MAYRDLYEKQVALLVRVMPFVADEAVFALNGGTAINLFVRDMPRLSVDIDLTYVPVEPREASLRGIDAAMRRVGDAISKTLKGARVATRNRRPRTPARQDGSVALIASESGLRPAESSADQDSRTAAGALDSRAFLERKRVNGGLVRGAKIGRCHQKQSSSSISNRTCHRITKAPALMSRRESAGRGVETPVSS